MNKKEIQKYKKEIETIESKIKKSFGVFKKGSQFSSLCDTGGFAQDLLNNILLNIKNGFGTNIPLILQTKELENTFTSFLETSYKMHQFILKMQNEVIKGFELKNDLGLAMEINDQLFKYEGLLLYSFNNTINSYLILINNSQLRYNQLELFKNNLLSNQNVDGKLKKQLIKKLKLNPKINNYDLGLYIETNLPKMKGLEKDNDLDLINFYS